MYIYTFVRVAHPRTLSVTKNYDIHFENCRNAIITYTQNGWRFVSDLTVGGMTELVFERLEGS